MPRKTRTAVSRKSSSGKTFALIGLALVVAFAIAFITIPGFSQAITGGISNTATESGTDVNYFCFTARQANSTVALNWVNTEDDSAPAYDQAWKISTDKSTWTDYTVGSTITLAKVGDKIYWRAKDDQNKSVGQKASKYYQFTLTGKVAASGSIMTLLDATDTLRSLKNNCKYCFYNLFLNCTALVSAPELTATTVASSCYCHMFEGCTSLVYAPDLPATELSAFCYMSMFSGCTALTTMPLMGGGSAITLDNPNSCNSMFAGCSKLAVYSSAGENRVLKFNCASVAEKSATSNMFTGCATTGDYNSNSPAPTSGTFACYGAEADASEVEVESIALSSTQATIALGCTRALTATITPADATNKSLTWSTSNKAVATVDENGLVSALAEGTCVITAKSANGKEASCTVTVVPVGDINGSGTINIVDAQIVLDMANGVWTSSGSETPYDLLVANLAESGLNWDSDALAGIADVNHSGKVDADDANAIQAYVHTGSWE